MDAPDAPIAWILLLMLALTSAATLADAPAFASHPPRHPLPAPSNRPLGDGPAYHAHPTQGDDRQGDGSAGKPWRTINHALKRLKPGDTLLLHEGVYYENVYCAIVGEPGKPITLRSAPGELAIIDGSMPEFQLDPAAAWQPAADGVEGEYVSTKTYPNIRDVVGQFNDSCLGLQTYWYRMDLQATNEKWIPNEKLMIDPMWCGPGLFYDKATGRIHARLAHTTLQAPPETGHHIDNYQGQTDPRKLALNIAPFASVPLTIDQGMHLRFEDLAIRGAGYIAVKLNFATDVAFDRCNIYAGTYGIWAKGAGPFTMSHCAVRGMIAPWMFRAENVMYSYSPKHYPPFVDSTDEPVAFTRPTPQKRKAMRHLTRLPTHAILVTEGGYEFETFYTPMNHNWDIHHCEFSDGHDGIYLSGRDIHFHHNLVEYIQDDSVYVSSPTPYITDGLYIYQNLIRRSLIGFGSHARGGPGGKIYLFRNVVDLRRTTQFNRPMPSHPGGMFMAGQMAWFVHNSDHTIHMEHIYMYHNTTLTNVEHAVASYGGGMPYQYWPGSQRRVFNNLHVYNGGAKRYPVAWGYKRDQADLVLDANLHWHADPQVKPPADYFATSRNHPLSQANKAQYPDGWDAHSIAADPKFLHYERFASADLRLQPDSPAVNAGVALPEDWPDPLRAADAGQPDIGATPQGSEPLQVGIDGRVTAGQW